MKRSKLVKKEETDLLVALYLLENNCKKVYRCWERIHYLLAYLCMYYGMYVYIHMYVCIWKKTQKWDAMATQQMDILDDFAKIRFIAGTLQRCQNLQSNIMQWKPLVIWSI
ncbi:hypothetical protein BCR42DRAFT_223066 [Absidia repens]|uniref:Uncharacterized protein n=1 Tax=Absidia repens TaxID=90262 RepID=A0A1X2IQH1_9FUNG|nr:hypothetical protein BCR42DRAFT_223066 [Absidia repens]